QAPLDEAGLGAANLDRLDLGPALDADRARDRLQDAVAAGALDHEIAGSMDRQLARGVDLDPRPLGDDESGGDLERGGRALPPPAPPVHRPGSGSYSPGRGPLAAPR